MYLNQGEISKPFVGWQPMHFVASSAPAASGYGNLSAVAALAKGGGVKYTWWQLGKAGSGWLDIGTPAAGTTSKPAVALVNKYLFVLVHGNDDLLYLNQGDLNANFVGWQSMGFKTTKPAAAASSDGVVAAVAEDLKGNFFYTWWKLGEKAHDWVPLTGSIKADTEPSVSLSGKNLYVSITAADGSVRLNQGELGGAFTGWQ